MGGEGKRDPLRAFREQESSRTCLNALLLQNAGFQEANIFPKGVSDAFCDRKTKSRRLALAARCKGSPCCLCLRRACVLLPRTGKVLDASCGSRRR
jgi:hypothetical protein